MQNNVSRFFGSGDAIDCIIECLQTAQLVRIATAYFEPSGYHALKNVLIEKQLHLLIGREQGAKDRLEDVIEEFIDGLSHGNLIGRTRAMRQMLNALENGLLAISLGRIAQDSSYVDGRYLYQHAKLYIADENALVLTSANMSETGLTRSREAGRTLTDPIDVSFFVNKFDEYFLKARSVTNKYIEKLKSHLRAYDPFIIYARALIELYGLPKDQSSPLLPSLADYQRPVVSRILNNIEQHSGTMLIASTGLGKTVIASHVVAYLRMRDEIDSVIVVCPAGLRDTWRKYMRMARTSSVEFSYSTLSIDNPINGSQVSILEHELRQVSYKTLIILDESHHLRNDDGGTRLRNQRVADAIRKSGAKLMMMTATPFSKNIEDVNNQLSLLPQPYDEQSTHLSLSVKTNKWFVQTVGELSELPPCFVLTTPTVVKYFGQYDENGDRHVFFSESDKRYFPRLLHLRTIHYQNPLENFLIELLESKLLKQKPKSNLQQDTLFDLDEFIEVGKRNPLFESQIVHQFCSSPAKVQDLVKRIIEGKLKIEFAQQNELTTYLKQNVPLISQSKQAEHDTKFTELIKILDSASGEKVVVFCIYHETAQALVQGIKEHRPTISVETTSNLKPGQAEKVLRAFSPIANEVDENEQYTPVNVLIATGAIAEGFNLQDAAILVNYDLSWTVLQLAQRMGRILRPWHEPREIAIYNFIPSTITNSDLHVAMNWGRRLANYGEQHRSFADIPILLHPDKISEDVEMIELARSLQHFDQVDLNLDQVLEFIQSADQLRTTSFYDDLAIISFEDREFIEQLPPAIRSARMTKGRKCLFVLFQNRKRYYPVLFDSTGNILINSNNPDAIMKEIRCDRNEMRTPVNLYPEDDEFDEWIEVSKTNWAHDINIEDATVQVICSLALIPSVR